LYRITELKIQNAKFKVKNLECRTQNLPPKADHSVAKEFIFSIF